MKHITYFFIACFSVICFMKPLHAQFIVAGEVFSNDIYVDIEPDLYFYAVATHHGPPTTTHYIDIDLDGINDFSIFSHGGGGLMAGGGVSVITALHPSAYVVGFTDVFSGCCPANYVVTVADTLKLGDTINDKNIYHSKVTIWSATYGPVYQAPTVSHWKGQEYYFGVKLDYPFETLYGWIRAEDVSTGTQVIELYVKDFACNEKTVFPSYSTLPLNFVFPNPFSNEVNFISHIHDESDILIFDISGIKMYHNTFIYSKTIMTDNLASGIYFYELRNTKGTIARGKMLKY